MLYTVDEFAVTRYDLAVDEGVLITQVGPGSPADKAGLAPGDVITSFAGRKITTAEDMIRAIYAAEIGELVEIIFWRGNTENATKATLAERPQS